MPLIHASAFLCSVCNHVWLARGEAPPRCPACKSRRWDEWKDGDSIPAESKPKVKLIQAVEEAKAVWRVEKQADEIRRAGLTPYRKADPETAVTPSRYARPKHPVNCPCFSCKPPKVKS